MDPKKYRSEFSPDPDKTERGSYSVVTYASDLWVAGVAGPTLTHIVAGRVGAQRVLPTRARQAAFVHIHAARRRVGGVVGPALLAHAEGLAGGRLRAAECMR